MLSVSSRQSSGPGDPIFGPVLLPSYVLFANFCVFPLQISFPAAIWKPWRWWITAFLWNEWVHQKTVAGVQFSQTVIFKWTAILFICTVILRELQSIYFYPNLQCLILCSFMQRVAQVRAWLRWSCLSSHTQHSPRPVSQLALFKAILVQPFTAVLWLCFQRMAKKHVETALKRAFLPHCMLTASPALASPCQGSVACPWHTSSSLGGLIGAFFVCNSSLRVAWPCKRVMSAEWAGKVFSVCSANYEQKQKCIFFTVAFEYSCLD